MSEVVNIEKSLIEKDSYKQIIDTEFVFFVPPTQPDIYNLTTNDFFILYEKLFFEIPIDGEFNSHKELIKRSTEYVGETQNTEETDLLLEEINQLRLQLIESRQIIDELTK